MAISLGNAFIKNFLGKAPDWYKVAIIAFLIINPIVFFLVDPFVAGWLLVVEFIFTLAMALKCYPLQPGGLLAIEAVAIGMTSPEQVKHELVANIEVLLLLVFMVAGIYFMKQLLLFIFTKILIGIRSKVLLSLAFCVMAAFLSAFLDALTVIAVVISVTVGFYSIYHKVASEQDPNSQHDHTSDENVQEVSRDDLENYRAFLRSLLMHAGIGTALGGVTTMVGEPQNLIIADQAGWQFGEFIIRMAPVTVPVFICGLLTCILVEKFHLFGYGARLPENVRKILVDFDNEERKSRTNLDYAKLIIQVVIAVWLIVGLALHLAAVGLIGLTVIILATSFTGITEEHALGKAFEEALPFTALLAVFFSIVAVIIDQHLFAPIIQWVLSMEGSAQLTMFYVANGILSMVSDNVFVGTVYINEVKAALLDGVITRDQFDMLAVAINTGTNLPSVATPNGQAAFLFALTSAIAPLIRLSYGRMVYMALPYTIVLTLVGLAGIELLLVPMTHWFEATGWLTAPAAEAIQAVVPAAH
ncbi:TPA: Na(+)/H(+) antiporter NhaB [Photobacterium damselae]|uniref:Na(+)/H(+) antiporter NhaB n=2 Tax=Photobacterium damselae TaxID=38293 RepID=D0YVJ6_PHODD|nr:Na(+)/H(+) antiporter NhaB [Photobacterium damselae]AWK81377.1 Na+/H+ antiporter NhaB [Photobacterium damselae]EEZ40550.1 putative Na+/H+-exchanging protein [Photobacterium damselae subsp. damselae CIP 102761]EHA1081235.1 Na(+)/H(+) antiporter NhaB [Photobacterium damselae]KAB1182276.1 Na(+)/H(+) antiporter NhaB [Photobacterium damselae subsp. damselae]MBF7100723.1 Na(+)/H(+) antiporter NhaB [Photobacterium damselae]